MTDLNEPMDVVGNPLLAELQVCLDQVNEQIEQLKRWAENEPFCGNVHAVRDIHGGYVMTPLLTAKASLLVAITELRRSSTTFVQYVDAPDKVTRWWEPQR